MKAGDVARMLLELEGVVDLVAHRAAERIVVSGSEGSVTLSASGRVVAVAGVDPLADQQLYPYGHESVAQIFSAFESPDVVISHDPRHQKYNTGDHGSLQAAHATAPFIAAGPGIAARGRVPDRMRMVDVAPTVAALLDVEMVGVDGEAQTALLTGEPAPRAVMFLLDGTNPTMLQTCIDDGLVPNIAAIADAGTTLDGGVIASFPTVTLANHTTILTGCHPGRSGVLANQWHDRLSGETIDLLELDQMMRAADHLAQGVETLHHAIHHSRRDAFTASTFEYCDAGADWSSFAELRNGRRTALPVRSRGNRHVNPRHVGTDWYRRQSVIDASSAHDAIALIDQGREPDFMFVNFSLTDETGHQAGPFSETMADALVETDARVGDVLAAIDASGASDDTAVLVLADHGMAECDPTNDLVISHYLAANGVRAIVTEETLVWLD